MLIFLVVVSTALLVTMSASAHLAVQRNAFSTAAAAAKIIDGATSASIAERHSQVQVNIAPGGASLFVLFPNMTMHAFIARNADAGSGSAVDNSSTSAFTPANYNIVPTIHRVGNIDAADKGTASVPTGEVVTGTAMTDDKEEEPIIGTKYVRGLQKYPDAPDEYRLVSGAMRLTPINASDSNNGWFEAVRIRPSWALKGSKFYLSTTPVGAVFGVDTSLWEEGILQSGNWSNDPSYVTGRLRDLGKHTFYLQNVKGHKFHRWPLTCNTAAFDDWEEQPFGTDTNFDVVAVRVYSSVSSTETLKQSIHCHVVKNWESMYDSNKSMARFMTSTISSKRAVDYTDKQMNRDPKASMIRSASSYSYRY